ncbi:YkvA family protein [Salinactinospora qingdaonensis]|uniref:DUF1232 domain-containing protein n=1 Tax=Salinactinospora qingdaonensis TaxID=702744 RepID=A0ABP7F4J7_9ACTN
MRKSNRAAAGAAAWRVVHEGTAPGKPSLGARIAAMPRMFGARLRGRYTRLSTSRLVLFLLALAYIISPFDMIPELVFLFPGLVDDVGIAVWLTASLIGETERYLEWEQRGTHYVEGNVVD